MNYWEKPILVFIFFQTLFFVSMSGAADCPATPEAWDIKVDKVTARLSEVYIKDKGAAVGEAYFKNVLSDFSRMAKACLKKSSWKPVTKNNCFKRVIQAEKENKLLIDGGTSTWGHKNTEVPKLLRKEEFQNLIVTGDLEKVIKYIEDNKKRGNLPQGTIVTPFIASIENPQLSKESQRILIYVPGNPKKYISYISSYRKKRPGKTFASMNVSVVSVVKSGESHESFYADYYEGVNLVNIGGKDCNNCHLGGPLPLSEMGLSKYNLGDDLKEIFKKNFRTINESMRQDGMNISEKYANIGPLFGDSTYPIDEKFINRCARLIQINRKAWSKPRLNDVQLRESLSENLKCASCHNYKNKNNARPLHWHGFVNVFKNIKQHINSGNMPRNLKLPQVPMFLETEDKNNLIHCLELWAKGGNGFPSAMELWFKKKMSCTGDMGRDEKGHTKEILVSE